MTLIPAAIYPGELSRIADGISESLKLELIQLTLASAVPIEVDHLRKSGGPDNYQRDAAHAYIQKQSLSEAILFCSLGKTGEEMRVLCEIAAILAFCPGGVRLFGLHFEACKEASRD